LEFSLGKIQLRHQKSIIDLDYPLFNKNFNDTELVVGFYIFVDKISFNCHQVSTLLNQKCQVDIASTFLSYLQYFVFLLLWMVRRKVPIQRNWRDVQSHILVTFIMRNVQASRHNLITPTTTLRRLQTHLAGSMQFR